MSTNPYLRQLRARWMLSQEELASLLCVTQGRISRYENGEEYPPLSILLGLQVVFGKSPRAIFQRLYGHVESEIVARATAVEAALRGRTDQSSVRKRYLVEGILARADSDARP